jgi:hypothetical protein
MGENMAQQIDPKMLAALLQALQSSQGGTYNQAGTANQAGGSGIASALTSMQNSPLAQSGGSGGSSNLYGGLADAMSGAGDRALASSSGNDFYNPNLKNPDYGAGVISGLGRTQNTAFDIIAAFLDAYGGGSMGGGMSGMMG